MRRHKRLTKFGQLCHAKLKEKDMSVFDLICEVEKNTGMFLDERFIKKILYGLRVKKFFIDAICEVLEIEN